MLVIDAPQAPESLKLPTIVGVCVTLFGFVGFLLWAAFTPLDSAIVATGSLKVGSEKKQIQHFEGGIVKQLQVSEGDVVSKGQVLLTLDETFANAEHAILHSQIQELRVRELVLLAQRDQLEKVELPEDALAFPLSPWIEEQLRSAMVLFEISHDTLQSQLSVLQSRQLQLSEKISGYRQEISAKEEQIRYMEEELEAWGNLIERQYANKLRYLELKREKSEVQGELIQLHSVLATSESQIEELRFERENLQQSYREAAGKELVDVQLRLKDLSERLDSAQNVLGRVAIKAPVDGKVVGLNVYTIGAVIRPGVTILEIVPARDELVISAKIRPVDIDKIHQDMAARVRISAYKFHELPEFFGLVESVSADVFEDPKTLEPYYTARIRIPESVINDLPKDKLNPGMPAEVMIVTGESTPAQYLLEPLLSAFRTAWRDD